MGFQKANNTATSTAKNDAAKNDDWKSDAFINFSIPTRSGGRRKLGAIGLKMSKPMQKDILDFLADNGEEGLAQLKERLIIDFQRSDGDNGDALDLSVKPAE
jgi:hypothetical protein